MNGGAKVAPGLANCWPDRLDAHVRIGGSTDANEMLQQHNVTHTTLASLDVFDIQLCPLVIDHVCSPYAFDMRLFKVTIASIALYDFHEEKAVRTACEQRKSKPE